MNSRQLIKYEKTWQMAILMLFVGIILSSCSTIAPKTVFANEIAFDKNIQSAGIISRNSDGSWNVDDFFVSNFNRRLALYGKDLQTKSLPSGTTQVSSQLMETSGLLDLREKNSNYRP